MMRSWQNLHRVLLVSLFFCATSYAAEIKSIAILSPEPGTDFGWNQQGIDAAKAAGAKAGVKVMVAENLGYGDIRPALRDLIDDGAQLLIAHASGYNQAAPEIGQQSNVPVAVTDSPASLKAGLVADYTVSGHEGAYLAGALAAKMTRSGTIGVVVSGEPPSWNAQSNAFIRGARATKADIKIRYAVIGPAAYSDAAGGKRVTSSVIAAGADIIFGQGNGSSFGMLQAVETAKAADGGKVWFIDVIGDKSKIDKGNLLSSVLWNLTPVFTAMIGDLKADKYGSHNYTTSLADGSISLLKTAHIPDDVWQSVNQLKDQIIAGKIKIPAEYDAKSLHDLLNAGKS
ncbi:simple sugar transport system substrate-binding protein [Erwinia toletana]|uniref:Simple sugar transport system substrate-binding protein n=1 Tax=Winslowiella toletana TaxID=92490 RepID=A0ABS4PDL2_9GAMM|nr:BMP family ABC transporter substrate-binding protein [Winslowiella toletana]MBP2170023.1 simple sugar transport system substrate-binding protein [Winslowiella toletana]